MYKSESISKLAVAMVKCQAMLKNAVKDSDNPYFRSKYADLNSCWEACRDALTKNGLSLLQGTVVTEGKVELSSILLHESGEYMEFFYPINPMRQVKDKGWEASADPQSLLAAYTYARRGSLAGIIGLATEDDDGETAVGRGKDAPKKAEPKPEPRQKWDTMMALEAMKAIDNLPHLKNWWTKHFGELKEDLEPGDMQAITELKDALKDKFSKPKESPNA